MKKNWLLWGAVAVGAYLIYKKMSKDTDNGKEIAPPPVGNTRPPVSKPPVSYIKKGIAEKITTK